MSTERTYPSKETLLHGHRSEATAFVVEDYPYGFRLRCRIRYWVETTKHGDRFCSQTTNPKIAGREVWNKPKKSTYYEFICMYLDDKGHVTFTCIDIRESKGINDKMNFLVNSFGVENMTEAQQTKLRVSYYHILVIEYSFRKDKYSNPVAFKMWTQETANNHVMKCAFAELANHSEPPAQDKAEVKEDRIFSIRETSATADFFVNGNVSLVSNAD